MQALEAAMQGPRSVPCAKPLHGGKWTSLKRGAWSVDRIGRSLQDLRPNRSRYCVPLSHWWRWLCKIGEGFQVFSPEHLADLQKIAKAAEMLNRAPAPKGTV